MTGPDFVAMLKGLVVGLAIILPIMYMWKRRKK